MVDKGFDGCAVLSVAPIPNSSDAFKVVDLLVESAFKSEVKKARGVGRGCSESSGPRACSREDMIGNLEE